MNKEVIKDLTIGIDLVDFANKYCSGNIKLVGSKIKELENQGFNIHKKINDKGKLGYILSSDNTFKECEIQCTKDSIKLLIITDLHIGGENEGTMYMESVYKYAKENDIHIILNLGDLFHGVYPQFKDTDGVNILFDQLQSFDKLYPYDEEIINLFILGNHDYITYKTLGIDISKYINYRTDIINLGYGMGKVRIGEDLILLEHDLIFKEQPVRDEFAKFIFRGHSHKFEAVGNQVTVPALQDMNFYPNMTSVGFTEAIISLESNKIKNCILNQYDFDSNKEIRFINQISYSNKVAKVKKKTL